MATLEFDADNIKGSTNASWDGTFTAAAIFDTTGVASAGCLVGSHSALLPRWLFYINSSEQVRLYIPVTGVDSLGPVSLDPATCYLVAVGRTTGTSTPRFHLKNLTAGTAWAHSDGGTGSANPGSSASGYFKIGNWDETSPDSNDVDFGGDMALAAVWNGVNLSDAQVEELSANLKTSDWYNNTGGTPTMLTELNTASPTDIGSGAASLVNTGAALTGDDVDNGWTYDGVGTAAVVRKLATLGVGK